MSNRGSLSEIELNNLKEIVLTVDSNLTTPIFWGKVSEKLKLLGIRRTAISCRLIASKIGITKNMNDPSIIGEKYLNNKGLIFTIINAVGKSKIDIQFEDGTILKNVRYGDIQLGKVKNKNHKSIFGVGYLGIGKYNSKTLVNGVSVYTTWTDMLKRAYCQEFKKLHPTYKDVTVCEEWHCFQNFAEWFEKTNKKHMKGWHLDKDFSIKDNKIYNPSNCIMLPAKINVFFSGNIKENMTTRIKLRNKIYVVTIKLNGKVFEVGRYLNLEVAKEEYKIAKRNHYINTINEYIDILDMDIYNKLYNYER